MNMATNITKTDLEELKAAIEKSFERIITNHLRKKRYYTPAQYAQRFGLGYSTVVEHCAKGLLKAKQNRPGAPWIIEVLETDTEE